MKRPSAANTTVETAPIEILVLGGFSVRGIGGQGLGQIEGRTHVRALLALLAAHPQGVQRDEVADVLWPRLGEAAARNRLHHTMHLARQALGAIAWPDEWLQLQQGRVQLDPRVDSDAHRILRLVQQPLEAASEVDLLTALDQYRGEWAPEVVAGGLGHTVRRQFQEAHVALLKEAARRRIAEGDVPVRRQFLERIVDIQPADEWAYQQLMQLDLDSGRHHAALRLFEAAGRALGQKLGLRPSKVLADIAADAAARIGPDVRLHDRLAAPGEMLIDREPLIRDICAALRSGPGVWNVHGLGGVGKTALMREVMRRAGPTRPDGVIYVPLGDGKGPSIAQTVCLAAGLDPESELTTEAAFALLLASRDMLVVLDDLDERPEGASLLAALPAGLRSRVVAITRVPVALAEVNHVAVRPLGVPDADAPLVQVRLSPAIACYRLRRPVADVHEWSAQHWSEVIALVRKLDGLPLAIELAAARSATMTAGEILAQLEASAGDDESPGLHDSSYLHGPVGAALALSVRLLGPHARIVLHGCAELPGWFAPEDAIAVSEAAGLGKGLPLAGCLDELADAGLLERRDGRFRMLHLTRDHARREAAYAGLLPAIRRTRIEAMVQRLHREACDIESPGYTRWMDTLLACHDEALPLLDEVGAEDPDLFLGLLVPLMHSWAVRGLLTLGLRWAPVGIAVAEAVGDRQAAVGVRILTAALLIDGRRFDEALTYSGAALAEFESGGGDEISPVLRAHLVALHAEATAGTSPLAVALGAIDAELAAMQGAEQPGWWTLQAARLDLGQAIAVASMPGDQARVWPVDAWRARLAGSLTWCDLLLALSGGVPGMAPQERLDLCDELLACARELRAPRATHAALSRRAWAQMALGRISDAEATVIDWYRLARAAGRDSAATYACLWLAELSWRRDDVNGCAPWMDAARKLVADLPHANSMRINVALHEIVIDALHGALAGGIARFVALPVDFIATARRTALEHVVEAAALLAARCGLAHLATTLSQSLGVLSDAKDNVALVTDFRARHLTNASPVREESLLAAEHVIERARSDLLTLHEYWSAAPAAR